MEIPPVDWYSAAFCYAVFFGVSFLLLGIIALTGLPGVCRGIRRHFRLEVARHRRKGRMLADLDRLDDDARRLEGVYRFEENEPVREIAFERAQAAPESVLHSDAA